MSILVLTVGKLKEKYLVDAVKEYTKRIEGFTKISFIEIKDDATPEALKVEEKEILKKIDNYFVISLCIEGKVYDSVELSKEIEQIFTYKNTNICFIIGGSYGLSDNVKKKSDLLLSFSKLTFPHQLMKVMLLEQIYRTYSILNNKKYHK